MRKLTTLLITSAIALVLAPSADAASPFLSTARAKDAISSRAARLPLNGATEYQMGRCVRQTRREVSCTVIFSAGLYSVDPEGFVCYAVYDAKISASRPTRIYTTLNWDTCSESQG